MAPLLEGLAPAGVQTSVGAEPVPCGADLPAAVLQTCLRLPLCLPRPLISAPSVFIISAFCLVRRSLMVHDDTASSGQGVTLGLMHAVGSSLGSGKSMACIRAMFAG